MTRGPVHKSRLKLEAMGWGGALSTNTTHHLFPQTLMGVKNPQSLSY